MKNKKLLKAGACGTAVAGICCFTPILVVILSALGLSALIGYLDYVLMPSFLAFIALTAYALYKREQAGN